MSSLSTVYQLFINCLSTFHQFLSTFCINVLSTFCQFLSTGLSTLYQLLSTFYQLFINCYQLFINFLSKFINFLSTFYQLFINFLSTFYQLYQLFINFYQLLSTFYQQYQLFINVLSTCLSTFFYQLFINFLSTFNCFSFMSYISALPNIIFALHSLCSIDQSTFASYVSGAPQFRSPPVAANMHLKMILKFVYPHCLMHPPQQPLKGHWISMCNLQSVIFHPSTSWSTSITVIV